MLNFAEINRYQKILIKSSLLLFILVFVFVFNFNYVKAATQWESDPANCNVTDATNFPGQNCSPTNICGDDSGIAQCYDTPVLAPPSVSATSNTLYSSSYPNGGYIVNCYASVDSTAPYCDNNGSYWCNRSNDCYNNQNRATVCTADAWATASCGTCRSGFADCDGGGDACEIEFGVTDYPTGDHNNYADCTTAQCDSGWLDCDATGPGAGNGCEIQDGSSCTIGGLPGEYNGCTCEVPKQYFETGTDTSYSTSDPLLWGTQYGLGDLIHFGTDLNPDLFMVNNDGAVQMAQITEPTTTLDRLYNVGGDLYWNGSLIGSGSGSEQTLQDVADYTISTDGYVYADFGAVEFEDDGGAAKYEAQPGGYEFEMTDGSTGTKLSVRSESTVGADDSLFQFTDYRTTTKGLEYAADYSADFTARSLVDKAYVDGLATGSLWDTDLDTGIQVEEIADEDMIRFDIGDSSGIAYPDAMVIDNLGNVGVATSSPTSMFHIDDAPENMNQFKITSGGQRVFHVDMEPSGPGGTIKMGDIDAGTYGEVFTLNHSEGTFYFEGGNVGIGTNSPDALLDIGEGMISAPSGDTSIVLSHDGGESYIETMSGDMSEGLLMHGTAMESTDSGIIKQIYSNGYTNGWDKGLHIFNKDAEPIIFKTSDTEVARLDASGNLGVGTNNPQDKLEVYDGNLRLSNTLGAGCLRYNNTLNQLEYSNDCTTFNSFTASSGGGWTDDGSIVRLTTGTDQVVVGSNTDPSVTDSIMTLAGDALGGDIFLRLVDSGNSDIQSQFFYSGNALVMQSNSAGNGGALLFRDYNVEVARMLNEGMVVNEGGDPNIDFRVEGDTETHLIYADATNDFVGIANSSPHAALDIGEAMISTPSGDNSILLTEDGGESYIETFSGDMSEGLLMHGTAMESTDSGIIKQIYSNGYTNGWDKGLHIFNNDTDPILFRVNNNEQMRVVSDGVNFYDELGTEIVEIGNVTGGYDFQVNDSSGNRIITQGVSYTNATAGAEEYNIGLGDLDSVDGGTWLAIDSGTGAFGLHGGDTYLFNRGLIPAQLNFMEANANGNNYVGFSAPDSIAANINWVLPNADGNNGDVLGTDGAGNLSWVSAPTPTVANGLYNDAGTIKLGGDLTEMTYINHMGYDFVVREFAGEPATYFSGDNFRIEDASNDRVIRFGSSGIDYAGISFESSTNEHNIYYRDDALHITSDNLAFSGLQYAADYSANYTDRSLVDKAYVDSLNTSLWDLDGDTGIQVEETADDDLIRFDNAGVESYVFEPSRITMNSSSGSSYIGYNVALSDDGLSNYNVGIGYQTAASLSTGTNNQMIGYRAGYNTVDGDNNTLIGTNSGYSLTSGGDNVFIGYEAGYAPTTQHRQVSIGYHAGRNNTGAFGNTMVGYVAGRDNTGNNNIFLGYESGVSNTGSDNFFMGRGTGRENSGNQNVFLGYYAGYANTGTTNIMLGSNAGTNNIADDNIFIGEYAGYKNEGVNNIFIGPWSGRNNTTGANHVYLGADAGYNATGTNNVFIGYQAGYNETGSNILYIENSDSTTPLVYGQFDNDILRINGTLQVGHPSGTGYAFPLTDGTNGQYLQTDGSGSISWVDASNPTVANGLYDDAGTIKLGGALIENTSIDRNAGISFRITGSGASMSLSDNDNDMKFTGTNGDNGVFIDDTQSKLYYANDISGVETKLDITSNNIVAAGQLSFAGVEYDQDYSSNYTARSLVDKAYADSLVGGSLWDSDGDTGIQVEEIADEDIIRFDLGVSSSDVLIMSEAKGFDWRPTGSSSDFRARGLTDDNLLFVDVDQDNIGLGLTNPNTSAKLEVAGNVMLNDYVYFNNVSTDYIGHNGTEFVVSDDWIPSDNAVYVLGSDTSRWKTGYLDTLDVSHASGTVATFNRETDDGTIIALAQDGVTEGTITVSGNTVSYNAFTGSHYVLSDNTITKGMLVELTGENQYLHNNEESEILYGVKPASTLNSPKILGSYLSKLEPKQKQSVENPSLVMAEGNGDLWVVDTGDNIEAGDYLISSDVEGHAQLVDDNFAVNYVVARAAENVDWSEVDSTFSNKKHKLISVFFDTLVINTETVQHMKDNEKQGSLLLREELSDLNILNNKNNKLEVDQDDSGENDDDLDNIDKTTEKMQFGQAIVKAKQITKKVKFNKKFSNKPIVLLTLASDSNLMRYYVSSVDKTGFTINIYPSQLHDTLINWQALPNQDTKTIDVEDKKEDIGKKKDYTIIDAMTDLDAEFGEIDENNLDNNSNVLIIDENESEENVVDEDIEAVNEESSSTNQSEEDNDEEIDGEDQINSGQEEGEEVEEDFDEVDITEEKNENDTNNESDDIDKVDEEENIDNVSETAEETVIDNNLEVEVETDNEEVNDEVDDDSNNLESEGNQDNDNVEEDTEVDNSSDNTDSLSRYLLRNALALRLD